MTRAVGAARQPSRRRQALIIGFGVVLAVFVFWSIAASFQQTTGGGGPQAPWDAPVRLGVQVVRTVYAFLTGRSTNEDLFP